MNSPTEYWVRGRFNESKDDGILYGGGKMFTFSEEPNRGVEVP